MKKFLKNKTLQIIKNAQKNAVIKVFREKKIPFREFEINEFNERTLGELVFIFYYRNSNFRQAARN